VGGGAHRRARARQRVGGLQAVRRSRSQPFLGAGGRGCGRERALPLTHSKRVPLHHQISGGSVWVLVFDQRGPAYCTRARDAPRLQPRRHQLEVCRGLRQKIGSGLGNAQSLNVVEAVLPHALFLANIIDQDDFKALAQ
jgi:hypothetical protein